MDKDILTKVIEIEKEIQDTLDSEKRRSGGFVLKGNRVPREDLIFRFYYFLEIWIFILYNY